MTIERIESIPVLSKRDYFAAMAMQGLLANSYSRDFEQPLSLATAPEIASMARDQADHLIRALNEKPEG